MQHQDKSQGESLLSMRMPRDQKDALKKVAKAKGLPSVSSLIRVTLTEHIPEFREVVQKP